MGNSILSEADRLNQTEQDLKRQNELQQARIAEEMRTLLGDVYDPPEMILDEIQRGVINEVVEAIPAGQWIDDAANGVNIKYLGGIASISPSCTMYRWSDGTVHLRSRYSRSRTDIIDRAMDALPKKYDSHKAVKCYSNSGRFAISKAKRSANILRDAIQDSLRNYPIIGSRKYVRIWYYYDSDFVDKANFFAERKDTDFQYIHSHSTLELIVFDDGHVFQFGNRGFPLRETWVELVRQLRR
jgi:hypothetical protein